MQIFKPTLLTIDRTETRRYAGLQKAVFDDKLIEEACQEAQLLARPRAIWEIYNYDEKNNTVLSPAPFHLEGESIRKHLCGAEKVIFLSATLGGEIEAAVTAHFQEGLYAYSVLLDAAATTAVEQTADALEKTLEPKLRAQGYVMRWRFSPGYGDWKIENQPSVMRLALAEQIGISLTESLMLEPRKSITAVIGLVPLKDCTQPEGLKKGCAGCTMKNCASRRKCFT